MNPLPFVERAAILDDLEQIDPGHELAHQEHVIAVLACRLDGGDVLGVERRGHLAAAGEPVLRLLVLGQVRGEDADCDALAGLVGRFPEAPDPSLAQFGDDLVAGNPVGGLLALGAQDHADLVPREKALLDEQLAEVLLEADFCALVLLLEGVGELFLGEEPELDGVLPEGQDFVRLGHAGALYPRAWDRVMSLSAGQHLPHTPQQIAWRVGLGEELGPVLKHPALADGRVGVAGTVEDLHRRVALGEGSGQLRSAHTRHDHVGQQQVDGLWMIGQ